MLCLLALSDLLFIKRQEQVFDETPVAPAVKERSEPEPIQAQNTLDKAEQFISEQRYDNAIQELKRILMNDSNHQDAMLKLLQVYGITNNHKAFEQLHQKSMKLVMTILSSKLTFVVHC